MEGANGRGAKKVEFRCRIVKRERGLMGVPAVLCKGCYNTRKTATC